VLASAAVFVYAVVTRPKKAKGPTMKPVSELLKRQVQLWTVAPNDTVFDALKTLAEHEVGALCVMEGEALVGVFSERDYTRKVALQGRSSKETRVSEIMTDKVIVVSPSTRTKECMALMRERRIRHLPVMENGKVLGMLSIRDLMDDIIADHELTIAQLESYIHS
jgi:signal-transduction protein with cAMP-binding, CBS, and nucleotidyltransferase domain